jgi:hypothetical protein
MQLFGYSFFMCYFLQFAGPSPIFRQTHKIHHIIMPIEWASAQVPPTPLYLGGTVGRERERDREGEGEGEMDGWMDG